MLCADTCKGHAGGGKRHNCAFIIKLIGHSLPAPFPVRTYKVYVISTRPEVEAMLKQTAARYAALPGAVVEFYKRLG